MVNPPIKCEAWGRRPLACGCLGPSLKYLLRYGELGLKSSRVRGSMKTKLTRHITRLFQEGGGRCSFVEEEGRLFLESEDDRPPDLLRKAFGLVSFSLVRETSAKEEDVLDLCVELAKDRGSEVTTFAVRARRVGSHEYTSMEIARKVGSAVQAALPHLVVDLEHPDMEIFLEVRGEKAYVSSEIERGPGGLPLSTQGRVVALVEKLEGVLASWLMMKRGCWVVPAYLSQGNWARALATWNPDVRPHPIGDITEMSKVAQEEGAMGYVYPWTTPERTRGDLRPAFYPLMGLSSIEVEELRRTVLSPLHVGGATFLDSSGPGLRV